MVGLAATCDVRVVFELHTVPSGRHEAAFGHGV